MASRPFLFLSEPIRVTRGRPGGGGASVVHPSFERQGNRFNAYFASLDRAFQQGQQQLQNDLNGIEPEHVIVFEVIGSIDKFYQIASRIPGLEWLFELDADDLEQNEDFYPTPDEEDEEDEIVAGEETPLKLLSRRLYLVMSNRQGLEGVLRYWNNFVEDGGSRIPRGQAGPWRDLFKHLNDVRFWSNRDRLDLIGLTNAIAEKRELGQTHLKIEIELWYRNNEATRRSTEAALRTKLTDVGGTFISSTLKHEIRYHGVLAEIPILVIDQILENDTSIRLVNAEEIMFYRPSSQIVSTIKNSDEEADNGTPAATLENEDILEEPVIALLDGIPLQNHSFISSGLIIDDPDNFIENSRAEDRLHGTAMASLILNGDLSNFTPEKKLKRKIYVRPILKSIEGDTERMPDDILPVELIHRSVIRMLGTETNPNGVSNNVKVINLSIAEKFRPFINHISPLARMIDWLSYKYNILFIVSVGNYQPDVVVAGNSQEFEDMPPNEREKFVYKNLTSNLYERKILSPSESLNALSIGASYSDNTTFPAESTLKRQLIGSDKLFAPYSAYGLGIRNSIKPDFLVSGGRHFFRLVTTEATGSTYKILVNQTNAPGHSVALPSRARGTINYSGYLFGTSNSTALTTRTAALIYEELLSLRDRGHQVPEEFIPTLIKTLLAHGVLGSESFDLLKMYAPPRLHPIRLKNWMSRFVGYGIHSEERSLFSETHRAVALGFGELLEDEAHAYELPLPESFSGAQTLKRVVITLSWISPIDVNARKYRKAQLWFNVGEEKEFKVFRLGTDWQTAKKGTLQHEVFEGDSIAVFGPAKTIKIKVNCKSEASSFTEPIRYSLAVTIESADRVLTQVHQELETKIAVQNRVRVRART